MDAVVVLLFLLEDGGRNRDAGVAVEENERELSVTACHFSELVEQYSIGVDSFTEFFP